MDPPPPLEPHSNRDTVLLVGGGCLVVCMLCLATGGAVYVGSRFMGEEEAASSEPGGWTLPAPPIPPGVPAPQPAPEPPPAPEVDPALALAQMRRRYRPGPYVQVQGMLPRGLVAVRRMGSAWAGGHSFDNPWIVPGAEGRAGPPPPSRAGPTIRLTDPFTTALVVIPGAPAQLAIDADPGEGADAEIAGLVISFDGYQGHYFLPASVDSELGSMRVAGVDRATLFFGIDSPIRPDGQPAAADKPLYVTMRVSAVDLAGRISAPASRELHVQPLGPDLQRLQLLGEAEQHRRLAHAPGRAQQHDAQRLVGQRALQLSQQGTMADGGLHGPRSSAQRRAVEHCQCPTASTWAISCSIHRKVAPHTACRPSPQTQASRRAW